jgi:lipoyl-dependent peroxiredoxin
MKRFATAKWQGTGKEGKGTVTSQSGLFNNAQYSYSSRFEEGVGTNPEELVAAAHAGCFSMKLSFVLGETGITPDSIETRCTVTLDGGAITESHLEVKVSAPGLDKAKLDECAANAKENCPISKSLNTNITMEASLA